jgi:hypothetical protein
MRNISIYSLIISGRLMMKLRELLLDESDVVLLLLVVVVVVVP